MPYLKITLLIEFSGEMSPEKHKCNKSKGNSHNRENTKNRFSQMVFPVARY